MPALNQTELVLIAFKLLSYQCPLLLLLPHKLKTSPSKKTVFSPGACCSLGGHCRIQGPESIDLAWGHVLYHRWTPHPVIVAIRDNTHKIRVLLYS